MMRLHVICSEQPSPVGSGYAIEVFHQLEALASQGFETQVHVLTAGYDLPIGLMPDDGALLIEGHACCPLLTHPALHNRRKIVRLQYIQHVRTEEGMHQTNSPLRKFALWMKAQRERRDAATQLIHADVLCAITKGDQQRLIQLLPGKEVAYLPCFFDPMPNNSTYETSPFVLCHNHLLQDEDDERRTSRYIIDKVAPLCPGCLFVITQRQRAKGNVPTNVKLVESPSDEYLGQLIQTAQVHLMLATSTTGIGMQLPIALAKGQGHIVANHAMLYGHSMGRFCVKADKAEEMANAIKELMSTPISEETRAKRLQYLQKMKKARISRLSLFK